MKIPEALFVFKYPVISLVHGHSVDCERRVRARGVKHAIRLFKQEFKDWGEEVPQGWGIYDIWCINN